MQERAGGNKMIQRLEMPVPAHHFRCEECYGLFTYDLTDVTEFDNGSSLFWYLRCPVCDRIKLVSPPEYSERARKRLEKFEKMYEKG